MRHRGSSHPVAQLPRRLRRCNHSEVDPRGSAPRGASHGGRQHRARGDGGAEDSEVLRLCARCWAYRGAAEQAQRGDGEG